MTIRKLRFEHQTFKKALSNIVLCGQIVLAGSSLLSSQLARARDLDEIKKEGVIRHLGVPYANFVTGAGDGMSVEILQAFAKHLGVKYEYVTTDWPVVMEDLTGHKVQPNGSDVKILEATPIKGDVIANGLTVLPWREKVVNFAAQPEFPNQVWLVVKADSKMEPIQPTGNLQADIKKTEALLKGKTMMGKVKTCLDPKLYGLEKPEFGVKKILLFEKSLNFIAPAILFNNEAETAILDIPDILVAMQKWPGKLKVIGPISEPQTMGIAFSKDSPALKKEFDKFFAEMRGSGKYKEIVKKYYAGVLSYFPDYFNETTAPAPR